MVKLKSQTEIATPVEHCFDLSRRSFAQGGPFWQFLCFLLCPCRGYTGLGTACEAFTNNRRVRRARERSRQGSTFLDRVVAALPLRFL